MKKVLLLCLVFFVIPVSIHFAFNRENIDINEFRFNSGYEEVKLTDGITSYKDIGDKNNKTIIKWISIVILI